MNIFFLISLILISGISIITWAVIGYLWGKFRGFFHNNYSFFDVSFILAYFLEQMALIILFFKYPRYNDFWVSAFALIVLTTVSFQKLSMESRNKKISEATIEQKNIIDELVDINETLKEENIQLKETITKMNRFIINLQKKG